MRGGRLCGINRQGCHDASLLSLALLFASATCIKALAV
jgi:hypothetical protein